MLFRKVQLGYLIVLGCILGLSLFYDLRILWAGVVVSIFYVAVIIYGSFRMDAGLYAKAICKANHPSHIFTLSFDDGPDPIYTLQILDILEKYKARAIFFCIGHKIEKHPNILNEIKNKGHLIGNHSYSHTTRHGFLGVKAIESEIQQTESLIKKTTGHSNKLYRPPFGVTNPRIASVIKRYGLKLVGWNIRSFDTVAKDPMSIMQRIQNVQAGDIVLLHDTIAHTATVLDDFLKITTAKGLQADIIPELIHE
ncbi:polysaccharide deacetylase family protein [Xanthocytophaga agilis]|uniref:Polysaccharide deacetylase family protein n=1 Tax=Xanthocytophaga agilis TaxID=3048010 RepID=A0AAE3R232_9BACT|nr:polysaccharide deacetylase family protein [Xanthocytophaga agilis]MDJ1500172.1 polysaccharide deacetylase family protein [Xanthocytophaga agilis]